MAKSYLIKSAFWLVVSEVIFNLSGYIVHSGVGRILGPAEYGRYGIVVTLTTMIIILIGTGVPTAMSKYLSEVFERNPSQIRTIKKQTIIVQTIIIGSLTALFFIATPLIARALGDLSLIPLFRVSTWVIPTFAAASFYFYYYTGLHRFYIQSFLKITRSIVRIAAIIGLAYFLKTSGAVAGYIIAPVIVFIAGFAIDKFYLSKKMSVDDTSSNSSRTTFTWQKLVSFAWPLTLFLIFYELLISADLYLVKGILRDDYLTGIYNGAITVGRLPYYLFYALTIILLPTISKSTSEENHQRTFMLISQSLRFMLILLLPAVILMTIFAKPLIQIFYGGGYELAAGPMQIIVWGVGFLTIFYILSFVFNGAGKPKIPMWIAFWGLILNVILNYILIKEYALFGSAVAISITSFVIMLFSLAYTKKHFGVGIKTKSLFWLFWGGVFILAVSKFLPLGSAISILWSLPLLLIYFLLLFAVGEIKKEDINVFLDLVKPRKHRD